jgi:tetratricopeptide (TPR) repeat protein
MSRLTSLLFGALLAASAMPHSALADPAAVAAARRALYAATDSGSVPALLKARAAFVALTAAHPESASYHRWVAFASWRVAPLLIARDRKQCERIVLDGLAHCDKAIAQDPKNADAPALEGALQGMEIALDPGSMMTLGPAAEEHLDHALALDPRNPRVWLLKGIQTLHKPEQYGGGARNARGQLDKAAELFAARAEEDSTSFDWGWDDAYVWAGQSAMQLRDFRDAIQLFSRALEIHPANGWARNRWLPAARDSLAAAGSQ